MALSLEQQKALALARARAAANGAAPAAAVAAPAQDSQTAYDAALARVHQNEYPQMNDQQFADYAGKALAPYSPVDQAQNAQTLGFGDEIGAGIGAIGNQVRQWTGGGGPGFGDAYGDLQALENARLALGKEKNGAAGTAAEVVGGLSGFGPGSAPSAVGDALWQQMLKGGLTAAPVGAVQGFGSDNEDRLGGAVRGGVAGLATGVAAPVVANVAGRGWNAITDALATRRAAQATGIDPGVARVLDETMAADGSLGPQGAARIQQAGPEGMLADAGPSARQVLDTAVQSSGRAGALARNRIGGRVSRDAQAIHDALDATMGQPQGIGEMRANIAAGSAPARSTAYDAAYAAPIDYSSTQGRALEQMLNERVDPSIINAANALMRRDGDVSQTIMAQVGDDGSVTYLRMPDVRQIDYITRALNDKAMANAGLGALGGQTAEGRSFSNLSGQLRSTLREAVPEYGQALDTAADPIRRSQAVQFGSTALNPGVTRGEVATQLAGMTGPERAALVQGMRGSIDDALANVTRTVQDGDVPAREAIATLKKFSTRAAREKLALAMGEGPADQLLTELDRAAQSFELRAAVADNSKTFTRQNMNRRVNDMTASEGPVASLARGEPLNAGKRVVQALTDETPASILRRQDRMHQAIVDALTAQGPDRVDVLEGLGRFNAMRNRNRAVRDAFMTRAGSLSLPWGNAAAAATSQ